MPPDLRFESELQTLRQRRQGLREARLSHPRPRLVADVELCLREARERSYAASKSKQQMEHFLRRCRLEVGAARAAFEQDVKRHEAVFKNCEADRARRKAEAKQFRVVRPAKLVPAAPATLSSAEQVRAFDSWEGEFARFEASSAHADWGLNDVPWPPAGSCVTGIRVGDSTEAQRQRLKLALLRWHPDKFFSRNGAKLLKCDAADIMERVHAMLDQVQVQSRELKLSESHVPLVLMCLLESA